MFNDSAIVWRFRSDIFGPLDSGQDWRVDPGQGHLQISSHPFLLVRFTRREFSGMIHFITSNVIIPATPRNPSIPYV